jgi:hypothetical protein
VGKAVVKNQNSKHPSRTLLYLLYPLWPQHILCIDQRDDTELSIRKSHVDFLLEVLMERYNIPSMSSLPKIVVGIVENFVKIF